MSVSATPRSARIMSGTSITFLKRTYLLNMPHRQLYEVVQQERESRKRLSHAHVFTHSFGSISSSPATPLQVHILPTNRCSQKDIYYEANAPGRMHLGRVLFLTTVKPSPRFEIGPQSVVLMCAVHQYQSRLTPQPPAGWRILGKHTETSRYVAYQSCWLRVSDRRKTVS